MSENCGTGCQRLNHMVRCMKCGASFHFGLYHSCPTTTYYESGVEK